MSIILTVRILILIVAVLRNEIPNELPPRVISCAKKSSPG
jgi:hypothetical protein